LGREQVSRALIFVYSCCINVFSDRNREGFWPAPSTVEFGEFYRLCYNTDVCTGRFQKAAKRKLLSEQIIFLCSLAGGVKIYVTGLVWYASFITMGTCAACAKSENAPHENNTVEVFFYHKIFKVWFCAIVSVREKENR